jgi:hypothetical protein
MLRCRATIRRDGPTGDIGRRQKPNFEGLQQGSREAREKAPDTVTISFFKFLYFCAVHVLSTECYSDPDQRAAERDH